MRDVQTRSHAAYQTSWYLAHRIRKAVALIESATAGPLTVGSEKYDRCRRRGKYKKESVFGMLERGGKARTYHIQRTEGTQLFGQDFAVS